MLATATNLPIVIPDEPRENLDLKTSVYPIEYEGHFDRLLIPNSEINQVISSLAANIYHDYHELRGARPVIVCVLKGSSPFFQHLCDELVRQRQGFEVEFIRVSSYEGISSTGHLKISGGIDFNRLSGRHVLLVEDIIDTGTTLSRLIPLLNQQSTPESPKSIEVCTLLSKRLKEPAKYDAKYVGFTVPDHFVVGYGIDYNELYRDTLDIFVVSQKGIDFDPTTLY